MQHASLARQKVQAESSNIAGQGSGWEMDQCIKMPSQTFSFEFDMFHEMVVTGVNVSHKFSEPISGHNQMWWCTS